MVHIVNLPGLKCGFDIHGALSIRLQSVSNFFSKLALGAFLFPFSYKKKLKVRKVMYKVTQVKE